MLRSEDLILPSGKVISFDAITNFVSSDVDIRDIAHNLSLENRYNGSTKIPISVAAHSIVGAEIAPYGIEIHMLLHDAAEAYIKDIPAYLKTFIRKYTNIYDIAEGIILGEIYNSLGIEMPTEDQLKIIKHIDEILLSIELKEGFPELKVAGRVEVPEGEFIKSLYSLYHVSPDVIEVLYLRTFENHMYKMEISNL